MSGRGGNRPLTAAGAAEARALAAHLGRQPIDAIHSSPVRRARETAAILAEPRGLTVQEVPALDEVDFGDWTGRSFAELEDDPRWRDWNEMRAQTRVPKGENMVEVQERAMGHIAQAARGMAGRVVAMVSHCDVIRAVIAGFLGLSLDNLLRFDVSPASVSRLAVSDHGTTVFNINGLPA
ncbi:phosphoglycerate mutase [Altererythrobacter sp. B11]|nr:phosphoglycerate mutase [Altererythrobacter sp. B11]